MATISREQITAIAKSVGLTYPTFAAFLKVESGGMGFSPTTGKIIIQFEPHIFARYLDQFKVDFKMSSSVIGGKKKYTLEAKGFKITNGVEGQTAEWVSFNSAFQIHPTAAMLSTSLGLSQIMGFHYARIGYDSVNDMWNEFKASEYNQVAAMAQFIKTDARLLKALKTNDWKTAAKLYNGAGYAVNRYDVKLAKAYAQYLAA